MKSSKAISNTTALAQQYNDLREDAQGGSFLYPHEKATPNMTLYVENGVAYFGTVQLNFAGGYSPAITAPIANPRIDLLVMDSAGTLTLVTGAEAGSPSAPTYPVNKIVICEIYNRVTEISIKTLDDGTNGYIKNDVRPHMLLPQLAPKFLFDAVVDAAGTGDYTTLAAALAANKKRIFVKDGAYTEAELDVNNADTVIVGQSVAGTVITSSTTGGTAKAMVLNYSNFEMYNLTFNGKGDYTTDTIFYYAGYLKNINIHDCNINNVYYKLLAGDASSINFFFKRNRIDMTHSLTGSAYIFGFNSYIDKTSVVEENTFTCHTTSGHNTYATNFQGTFRNNWMTGIKITLVGATTQNNSSLLNNSIYAGNIDVEGWTDIIGNYFDNNSMDPGANGFITMQAYGAIMSNQIYLNYNVKKLLVLNGGSMIGNYMSYGNAIDIAGIYSIFCNNYWTNTINAAMTITIKTGSDYSQVNQNIVKGGGTTPNLVDNSTGSVSVNNIFKS